MEKALRRLTLFAEDGTVLLRCPAGLGRAEGAKRRSGDLRTPEGAYYVCLKKENGKYGPSLGLSYPSLADARAAAGDGRLDPALVPLFAQAEAERRRPPWGTALGGEIYIHAGGAGSDWTAGCVALEPADMDRLYALARPGDPVTILP